MKGTRLAAGVAAAAAAIALAAPAQADDYDYPFNQQLHAYGIYGPQDSTRGWPRSAASGSTRGVDHDPYKSASFIQHNLPRGTTQGQAFQFLGAAIDHYCPDQVGFVQQAGAH